MKQVLIGTLVLASVMPAALMAGEKEDALIGKITQAYGGDIVLNLSNYRVNTNYLSPTTGQSRSPDLSEIGSSTQILTVDLKNNKSISYDIKKDNKSNA